MSAASEALTRRHPVIDEPAFPSPSVEKSNGEEIPAGMPGMSLRDYFAAAVLNGMQANPEFLQAATRSPRNGTVAEQCAEVAYRYADAMLRERIK